VINDDGQFHGIFMIINNKDIIYIKITPVDTNEIKINFVENIFKNIGIKFNLKNNRNNLLGHF
jgi:hypothetical protein